ncbi:YdiU family protein [Paenibacillus sp. P96]|uniref:Protein nucleotidyltransferase YdiU n=1 Tax=Paenibacillus zeirhizosphaerae TaxID=2987519 RepID=A0ABT9FRN5_9BACL|nr:YdiU family protein [Paenibacillus sp. P96]MDP4097181.1 YdiU family protein [Paenibacillus sp. P96]
MTENKAIRKAGWNWDNSYTKLPDLFYSKLHLNLVSSPKLVIFNTSLAESLGLNVQALQNEESTAMFAGNHMPEGGLAIAQAYAGHQFGHFTMLGDGRALLLGEQMTPDGERFDIQLKGSGRTPYSRGGDGRAALGPMLREYIISEAMHALGIPTTRSLAVVTSGDTIFRETELPGAVLTRVAASHLRVGTFQYAAHWGTREDLRTLADYTLQRHYPEAVDDDNRYLSLLREVVRQQAALIAKWQLVGFIHGVMNTDNMALSGETIDYGPCAFMDVYNPATVFSSIDIQGRYAYGNQPHIGAWNLARFAESLLPLLHDEQKQAIRLAEDEIANFHELFEQHWLSGMRAKLGLFNEEQQDQSLVDDLLRLMEQYQADYTNTFLALTSEKLEDNALFGATEFTRWQERWQVRRSRQQGSYASSQELMRSSNPVLIPRNHRVEEALEAAVQQGDLSVMKRLLEALASPFEHASEKAEYCQPPVLSGRAYRTFCGT